jgi:hypothetical protein
MSKNIVDSVIEMDAHILGLLPSLRQIDYNGGYVNNWNTETFYGYVKEKSNITIQRDHGGIKQGYNDEYESFKHDAEYTDLIHIDPWKFYSNFKNGIEETIKNINFIYNVNSKIKYEVGTEEAIRRFSTNELEELINNLKINLTSSQYENIEYLCIQSGVGLDLINRKNTGTFNIEKLKLMMSVCKKFGKKSKEHNGDYLNKDEIQIRFRNGLDTLNIGPEIAQIETNTYLDFMNNNEIDEFYQTCLNSEKWKKWVPLNYDITNKEGLIMVCGHYNFNYLPKSMNLNDIQYEVKLRLKNKLKELINYV